MNTVKRKAAPKYRYLDMSLAKECHLDSTYQAKQKIIENRKEEPEPPVITATVMEKDQLSPKVYFLLGTLFGAGIGALLLQGVYLSGLIAL